MRYAALVVCWVGTSVALAGQEVPRVEWHLTARPWSAMTTPREGYLDSVEGICRFLGKHVGADGVVVDPILGREHQYSTPYFAFAVGTLVRAGRAKDLLPIGVAAMDHATECFAKGAAGIPDNHGEFFIPALAGALEVYEGLVPAEKIEQWRQRMRLPIEKIVNGKNNNWRAYAMRGQWMRWQRGLIDRDTAVAYVEDSWKNGEQRERIGGDLWNLYQDHQTDPEPHAVEAVGRVNLLGLVASGYDGPSSAEMKAAVERGTRVSLLLQDPTGQCPPDGRADDHVWNDVAYLLCFEMMAERAKAGGDVRLAGQYRRAAMLGLQSIQRWRRSDGEWAGSFYITKNRFDPRERVGYQTASNIGNYNGAVAIHLSEAYLARSSEIAEEATPAEIGGYAFATDAKFASCVADAGGMQVFAALRGDTKKVYEKYWTSLGVNRFSRVGWDSRLGPSDGVRDATSGEGVSFAPTWMEDGKWVRMADVPERYEGKFSVEFVHPLLVKCAIDYAPIAGGSGPTFHHAFVVTPDGVLAKLTCSGAEKFGVTWPVLENDGQALTVDSSGDAIATGYDAQGDQQCFIPARGHVSIEKSDPSVQGSIGWLRPVRAQTPTTFVYPRSASDPAAEQVYQSLSVTRDGYDCVLGSVHGSSYVGRTSAGGEGDALDCDGDGKNDVAFDHVCRFIVQLREGKITAVEADRKVNATIGGKTMALEPYRPVSLAATQSLRKKNAQAIRSSSAEQM